MNKILARFGKKKLASLKAEMPINWVLLVRQLSTVWKKKVAIITEIEEETGHKSLQFQPLLLHYLAGERSFDQKSIEDSNLFLA